MANSIFITPGAGSNVITPSLSVNGPLVADSLTLDYANQDVLLVRDAANTPAFRNGTAEQQLNIYGSYTSATAHSKLYFRADNSDATAYILTENGSVSGTILDLGLGSIDDAEVQIRQNGGAVRWTFGKNAAGYALSPASGGAYNLAAKFAINTAPTIASGFGTSPSIVASNGTAAFTIDVGTGGVASSGVITLPAATTGWVLNCVNITNAAISVVSQTAGTTTSATITNYSRTTGLAAAWTASDILRISATAY